MMQILQKFWLSLFSLLILWANFSFDVNYYFCGSHLVSISLQKAPTLCCKSKSKTRSTLKFSKKSCCRNTNFQKQATDQFKNSIDTNSTTDTSLSLVTLPPTLLDIELHYTYSNNSNYFHKNPILCEDRQLLFEVYLI